MRPGWIILIVLSVALCASFITCVACKKQCEQGPSPTGAVPDRPPARETRNESRTERPEVTREQLRIAAERAARRYDELVCYLPVDPYFRAEMQQKFSILQAQILQVENNIAELRSRITGCEENLGDLNAQETLRQARHELEANVRLLERLKRMQAAAK